MAVTSIGRTRRPAHIRVSAVLAVLTSVLTAVFVAPVVAPQAAQADPGEGGTAALASKLEEAATGYYQASALLAASQKRQVEITKRLRESELSLSRLGADIGQMAAERYKGDQLGVLNGLFTGQGDPQELLNGAAMAEYLIWRDDERLRLYREVRDESQIQQELLAAELKIQKEQLAELDKQKRAAEKALVAVGGMVSAGYTGPAAPAQPSPRNAQGGWSPEACSKNDPTSGGCLTARTYHALLEAQLAGFTRYVHCWRTQSWGEHPRGRACDFAANKSGFVGAAATGADKAYGTKLATWCVQNASALGVLYVIWYRQIWLPGIGWRAYSGYGDPASEHTNHVHLSII